MIETLTFAASDCEVVEGCTQVGTRKLLRFDFLCWNAGTADLRMGSPSANPQWYEFSPCHGHFHLKDFNGYKVFNSAGRYKGKGNKQAFCLEDSTRWSGGRTTKQFTCSNQGVSGWADLYGRSLDCQFIDITGLPDGDYVVEARTNRNGVAKEDWYGDNFTWAGARIQGSTVAGIPVPGYPEDCLSLSPARVQVRRIGGRWKVVDGDHWILDFGSSEANAKKARDIIKHYKMDKVCFVGRPSPTGKQLMMYWNVGNGVPSGPFPGEDAIPIRPDRVKAQQANGRWKVVDGTSWLLDFSVSEANARKAAWLIKHYDYRYQCFVGRPNPPMMYFRR